MDDPGRFEWTLKAPEADLFDRAGRKIGTHYAGPTWESGDGSKVVGEVKGRDNGPDPSAIPWLLLAAKSNSGSGVLVQLSQYQAPHVPIVAATAVVALASVGSPRRRLPTQPGASSGFRLPSFRYCAHLPAGQTYKIAP